MKYGFAFDGDEENLLELAQEAEAAGWDGVFVPDDWGSSWIRLTAIAMRTERIRLGTMLTALPQHHPWTVAAQAATLDHVSNGRVILTVGLGVLEMDKVGLRDNATRAQMLDEGLEILDRWWQGEPMSSFTYHGRFYHLEEMPAQTTWDVSSWTTHAPLQRPRIPIWVVGGEKRSQIRRAARWDGALIAASPEEIRQRKTLIEAQRVAPAPLEIIAGDETSGEEPRQATAIVRPYVQAGVTWWIESRWQRKAEVLPRIRQGPPHLDASSE